MGDGLYTLEVPESPYPQIGFRTATSHGRKLEDVLLECQRRDCGLGFLVWAFPGSGARSWRISPSADGEYDCWLDLTSTVVILLALDRKGHHAPRDVRWTTEGQALQGRCGPDLAGVEKA